MELTHWKKLKNPDYLGSYALQPGQELIVTIKSCGLEQIAGTDGKKQDCLVLHFTEADIKPMIINNTNAKTISKVLQTPYMEQWQGKAIQIYARRIRAFGEYVDALRIRDFVPQLEQLDPTSAIQSLHRSKTLAELKKNYTALSKAEQGHSEVIDTKDKLKQILS